jgi:uncharacterized protein
MESKILKVLHDIEASNNVKILFACDGGSRAYGLNSEQSDYDVRFVYVILLKDRLKLSDKSDVIEKRVEVGGVVIDFVGWELRKALKLARAKNPTFYEWCHSPIIYYVKQGGQFTGLKHASARYSDMWYVFHYFNLLHTMRKAVSHSVVNYKDYAHAIRALLNLVCIVNKVSRPIDVNKLVDIVSDNNYLPQQFIDEIKNYIKSLRSGFNSKTGERLVLLSDYINAAYNEYKEVLFNGGIQKPDDDVEPEFFDKMFFDTVWACQ